MSQTQTWEKLEGNEGTLTITVPAKEFEKALDEAFKKVSKEVQVPGFRKGKIPRQMFEQRFGVESLYQDALDMVLPHAYGHAVEETGISPVDQPEVEVEEIEKGKDLVLKMTVTVEPEVKLGEYKGLEAEKVEAEVTDAEVDEQIEAMLAQYADLVVKEEGEVAQGDIVNLDFEGFLNDEPFEGGKAEGHELEIGSGQFIPGFEEQLVGLKSGDEKDLDITFPEEYHAEELAGKPVVFKVKINEIKQKETPEFNDAFVKEELEGFDADTAEGVKESIKKDLVAAKEEEADFKMKESLVSQASDNAEIDVPEAMVRNEQDRMLQEFEQRLSQQGLNLELYEQLTGQGADAMREQMKEDALKRVRTGLTLGAIAEAEGITVDDSDVDNELSKLAEQFNMPTEDVKKVLGDLSVLKADVMNQKAIDFLVENQK
ncbi:trigger factor [Phocicoccus schoeneichii]|uniref:Trigger factor n=1 Tax=Phocicoccus schoeneichii TaxID=1812261 RepID=A0A6V7RI75_9BACL|nr:trigger factor [Jeotgalicoccus schoeneichii]GGH47090.1 trigger factor [Jeotgalicoccus schoeneichii]CAD2077735.1 Trigger factor [Jeotgalicoccus schoeneichii]